jgi:nitrate reductase beta subunit
MSFAIFVADSISWAAPVYRVFKNTYSAALPPKSMARGYSAKMPMVMAVPNLVPVFSEMIERIGEEARP